MRNILALTLTAAVFFGCKSNESVNTNAEALETNIDSLSYAIGMSIGANLESQGIDDINEAAFIAGFRSKGDSTAALKMSEADAYIRSEMQRRAEAEAQEMKAEGMAFLDEKRAEEGVMETESGLLYKVIEEGTGASPVATDQVTVHYEGTLIDGEKFDSSYDRGEPATFGLNRVISGWTEGLQLMKEGATYEFYIPYNLAYGERGKQGAIPPYSTLVFKVELISVGNK
jgi:FKBP-type peptidyl-prolyl cis-trans isomerase